MRPRPFPLALAALSLGAAVAVLWLTRHGVGVSNDSSLYLGAAESVVRGEGLRMPFGYDGPAPLTHFPPLYSLVLALGTWTGFDTLAWARGLGAALFAANVALAGLAVRRYAPERPGAAVTAALLMLCSLDLLYAHGMVWSEPLYLALAAGGLLLLSEHLRRPSTGLLAASAAACGLAWGTRYVGAALVAAGVLGILLAPSPLPRGRRVRGVLVFGGIASLPMAAWLARGAMLPGSATNRDLAWHPITRATLAQGLDTVANWLLPAGVPGRRWLALAGVALLAAGILTLVRREERGSGEADHARALPVLHALHLVLYAVLLAVSISLADATTPLDFRILSPTLSSAIVLACCAGARLHDRVGRRRGVLRALVPGTAVVAVLLFAGRAVGWMARHAGEGQAYASAAWRTSPTVAVVRRLPAGARIHTNLPEALHLLAGRESRYLPRRRSSLSRIPNPRFEREIARIAAEACAPSYVVLFRDVERPHLASRGEILSRIPLRLEAAGRDGEVFRVRGCEGGAPSARP